MSNNTTFGIKENEVRPGLRKKGISWPEKENTFYSFGGRNLDLERWFIEFMAKTIGHKWTRAKYCSIILQTKTYSCR